MTTKDCVLCGEPFILSVLLDWHLRRVHGV